MVFRSRAVITVFLAACLSEGAADAFQQPPGVPGQGAAPGSTDRPPVPSVQQTSFEAAKETFPNVADGRVAVRIRASVNGVPILDEEVREACIPFLIGTLNLPEP